MFQKRKTKLKVIPTKSREENFSIELQQKNRFLSGIRYCKNTTKNNN